MSVIRGLGFVQLDSVSTVERAHHMILHARRTAYRPAHLAPLLDRDRLLFEHWTHDAAILPTDWLPHWRHRFARDAARLQRRWKTWREPGYEARFTPVLDRIAAEGPLRSDDFTGERPGRSTGWWDWHPSKTALEYLWRTGQLAVARRDGFRKVYDLASRIYPDHPQVSETETLDWAATAALDRLGFASPGELAAFWDLATPEEMKTWAVAAANSGMVEEILVEGADGRRHPRLARPGTVAEAQALPPAPGQIRVLSPFDPMIRDRARTERLFGFHYRIEIFVPAHRRRWGYYVFPLLEGERLVGRIDMSADRKAGALHVAALWPEPGVRMGTGRRARLDAALARTARFAGLDTVTWAPDALRPD
ncbi:winged helix-turn-helix domain-containing protein [Mesobaculum littorinae]|uniref:Winged helix-turn-helix domain-containing protein n=2 Tax=Mesobaculum littorinae TaxID=2486419 RepID=A0A438AE54_9RHOB|nr:winged helix-turn-helix domain-containing protein [Mesobaculum littorinae]